MPLQTGRGSMGPNIAELIKTYQSKGKIGNSTPKNKAAAQKQAVAIAYRVAGKK